MRLALRTYPSSTIAPQPPLATRRNEEAQRADRPPEDAPERTALSPINPNDDVQMVARSANQHDGSVPDSSSATAPARSGEAPGSPERTPAGIGARPARPFQTVTCVRGSMGGWLRVCVPPTVVHVTKRGVRLCVYVRARAFLCSPTDTAMRRTTPAPAPALALAHTHTHTHTHTDYRLLSANRTWW